MPPLNGHDGKTEDEIREAWPFSPFFPPHARARGECRFQPAISFLCLAGRQLPCRRRSATPTALRSYAVAADGRPRPRFAAMEGRAAALRDKVHDRGSRKFGRESTA